MRAFSITDIGLKRTINQDYVFCSENAVGNLPNLFIVADGMGGHKAGDFASKYTVDTLVKYIRDHEEENPIKIIREGILFSNRRLLEKSVAYPEKHGMGTTLVAATAIGNILYVANVGDSRLYVVNESIRQVTKDHSLVEEMVDLGEITKEEARNHPDKNIITRAIGVKLEVIPDFFEVNLNKGDTILMCSDGLSNMVEDENLKEIIQEEKSLSDKAAALIRKANEHGGKDNIAVVIVEPFTGEVNVC
jgi:serine/threonine protein phosphatase PrpC